MKKLILTITLATVMFLGCKKEAHDEKECATITGEGYNVLDKAGSIQRWFSLSNGKKVKTYINTKDAYHVGDEICYRPDELFNQ